VSAGPRAGYSRFGVTETRQFGEREPGETPALRELREEAGYEARILRPLGQAGQHVRGYNKLGSFFLARASDRVWLSREEALGGLVHASHRLAVDQTTEHGA